MSDLAAQYIAVGIILAIAIVWVAKRVVRRYGCRKNGCGGDDPGKGLCDGCSLADHCRKKRH